MFTNFIWLINWSLLVYTGYFKFCCYYNESNKAWYFMWIIYLHKIFSPVFLINEQRCHKKCLLQLWLALYFDQDFIYSFLLTLSLLAATCHLLITFANSLDPDQDRKNVSPDLDPNRLTLIVFLKEFFLKSKFWKKLADDNNSMKNDPACKRVKPVCEKMAYQTDTDNESPHLPMLMCRSRKFCQREGVQLFFSLCGERGSK